jgi:serine/threonine-protein kinase
MARVYVAEQISMGRNVAIKILLDDVELDDVAVSRFRQEVKAVAQLRSPHTIHCFDTGKSDDGARFIAMELLAGETLRQRLERETTIPGREIVDIAAQIGASLQEAHEAGVLHRDLKPENIYLCVCPTPLRPFVKVLDFGLAKLIDPDPSSPRLTAERQTVGTPAYMAPEMIVRERAVDHRADIYALGVMCFEMLTGRRPFHAKTALLTALAHVTDPIPSACALDGSLPRAVDSFFETVMAKDAADRPSQATIVAPLLAAALDG